jgi:hypothetical protein
MNRFSRLLLLSGLLLPCGLLSSAPALAQETYEVERHETGTRWNVWASEGPSVVLSGNQSYWGNRFRLGGEVHLGGERRWIFGMTFLDFISSAEQTTDVGEIHRAAVDFSAGYFLVPDTIWFMYAFHLEDVRGSRISGGVAAFGHELSVGYRFYANGPFNLSVDLSYLYVGAEDVSVIELTTGAPAIATFPAADVISLGLRFGVDFR